MNPGAKFLLKLLIFLLPFIAISVPMFLSWEWLGGKRVSNLQQKYNYSILYGPVAETQYGFYKAESVRLLNPSIIVIGDSRALEIRRFFFNENVTFYNAGYAARNTAEIQYFLESQDVSNIDLVIFALNHFSFNLNWADVNYPNHTDYIEPPSQFSGANLIAGTRYIADNLMAGKRVPLKNISTLKYIGLNAAINQNGMLNDGSYFYGEGISKAAAGFDAQQRVEDTLSRIESANRRFQHGEKANPNAVYYLEQFLQYCLDNHIDVICFAPPYAPTVNDAMREKGAAYAYQQETLEIVPRIFDDYGYEFFDYTDAAFLGCTDDFYLDGFHGSDVVYLRMFINMIERGSRLGEYCSLEDLHAYDKNRSSNISLLETWEDYNALTLI